ncbi:hypothetical protein DFH07DRAFT_958692 [Mycena maculata]|uniref:Uncharacterized protein n=1 Tax=Mycena maculata TaxID=230809 RepID=A0AAD7J6P7_9AGAR|nr:hypothetical protein DFH07DRAFT_958692 [Mycena maculata]
MRIFETFIWHLSLLALCSAVPTNHTIDDQAPGISYSANRLTNVEASQIGTGDGGSTGDFDARALFNGTISYFFNAVVNSIEVNFTGNAIYVFTALPPIGILLSSTTSTECEFFIDGKSFGPQTSFALPGSYDIPAYSNNSIQYGAHTLRMVIPPNPGVNFFAFDYLIYTSDDPDTTYSSTFTSTEPSSSISAASTTTHGTRAPIASIAGGVVGGIAALLSFGIGLLFCRRARRRCMESATDLEKSTLTVVTSDNSAQSDTVQTLPSAARPEGDAEVLAELRTLTEEFRQFRQHAEGGGAADSPATIKQDRRAHAVQHHKGYGSPNALVHTDGGLRLLAGLRLVDELPPTYED